MGNHERDWPGSGDRFPAQYDSGGEVRFSCGHLSICGAPEHLHCCRGAPRSIGPHLFLPHRPRFHPKQCGVPYYCRKSSSPFCLSFLSTFPLLQCGIPYYRRTRMPTAEEDKPWFSFDFGPIHFIQYSTGKEPPGAWFALWKALSGCHSVLFLGALECAPALFQPHTHPFNFAEHLFERGSEQRAWIEADLNAVNRSRTPWVVVGGHRPVSAWGATYVASQGACGMARKVGGEAAWLKLCLAANGHWATAC